MKTLAEDAAGDEEVETDIEKGVDDEADYDLDEALLRFRDLRFVVAGENILCADNYEAEDRENADAVSENL